MSTDVEDNQNVPILETTRYGPMIVSGDMFLLKLSRCSFEVQGPV
jgi:hypothetical protein